MHVVARIRCDEASLAKGGPLRNVPGVRNRRLRDVTREMDFAQRRHFICKPASFQPPSPVPTDNSGVGRYTAN